MTTTTTPSWTADADLVAITTVALNAVSRTTFSLNGKLGALIHIWLGRGGTTALTNGVDIRIRRALNNGSWFPAAPLVAFRSQSAACVSTTCTASGTPNNAGVASLTVASTTSFAAGDVICIQDNATPTSLTEWAVVARVTSSTVLLLDHPTINAHNNTAHTVRNKADYFQAWIEGAPGATSSHELVIDYGDDTAGEAVTVQARIETFDSLVSV